MSGEDKFNQPNLPKENDFLYVQPEAEPASPAEVQEIIADIRLIEAQAPKGLTNEEVLVGGVVYMDDEDGLVARGTSADTEGVMSDICIWKAGALQVAEDVIASVTIFPSDEDQPNIFYDIYEDRIIRKAERPQTTIAAAMSALVGSYRPETTEKLQAEGSNNDAQEESLDDIEIDSATAQNILKLLRYYKKKITATT